MPFLTTRSDEASAGCSAVRLPSRTEYVITARGRDRAAMQALVRRQAAACHAHPVSDFVFGGIGKPGGTTAAAAVSEGCVVWLQGDASHDGTPSSVQSFAVAGIRPTPVKADGRIVGVVYEDACARYCRLSGIVPPDRSAPRPVQAQAVFASLATALEAHGFRFTDTVRTWFYLDRLLEWYAEFNAVRTAFFTQQGVFDHLVPASTGIGAANAGGGALSADLLAVQPTSPATVIRAVDSPLQGSAMKYRSSFSRAVEIVFPTHRSLLISGTASIHPDGTTAHAEDPAGQVDLTLRVVDALLTSRGMAWGDVTRGIAYFTDMAHQPLLDAACARHRIPAFPLAVAHADICRRDLTFEIEVDAVRT